MLSDGLSNFQNSGKDVYFERSLGNSLYLLPTPHLVNHFSFFYSELYSFSLTFTADKLLRILAEVE